MEYYDVDRTYLIPTIIVSAILCIIVWWISGEVESDGKKEEA